MEHWTCGICGKHTHEVDYDYLSGTDHLGCVLEKENNKENQIELYEKKDAVKVTYKKVNPTELVSENLEYIVKALNQLKSGEV